LGGSCGHEKWKNQDSLVEWNIMELIPRRKPNRLRRKESGMSIIELMIAMVVLLVGIIGSLALAGLAIGNNGRNRQQSNSTTVAQMVTEKIMSIPASASTTLTITDCSNTNDTINTAGTSAGAGAPLLSSGAVDFSQTAVANYSLSYTACGSQGRQSVYDVRWNIQTLSSYTKLLTVSAQLKGNGKNPVYFSLPVTIRTIVGQGT
jgi:Tfp pilus assembly protein PilV